MDWLLCIAITVFTGALCIFISNYISDYYFKGNSANAQKNFYWLPFFIIGFVCIIATGVNFTDIPFHVYLLFIFSGFIASVAGIFYYKALELSDSTDFGIFHQLSPVIYLILGWLFLNQNINTHQFIAFFIIFSAPILILVTTKKRSRQIRLKAILYTVIDIFIDASAAIIFVKFNTPEINFITEMGFVYIGKALGNLVIMLANPKWRKRYRFVVKSSRGKVYFPLTCELIVSTAKLFANNFALILAPSVALTSAITDSTKPIVIFFMGILLSLLWPKFGREKMKRKVILVHLVATILVVIGICLIQSS